MGRQTNKQLVILQGIVDMMNAGEDIYRMKVSDIARAAGMGKGTVYDYFDTKEEMIAQALLYSVKKWLDEIAAVVDAANGFKNKFFAVLKIFDGKSGHCFPAMKFISSEKDIKVLADYIREGDALKIELAAMDGILKNILDSGYEEGLILKPDDFYYCRTALLNSIIGYCIYIVNHGLFAGVDSDRAKKTAYAIALSALEKPCQIQ